MWQQENELNYIIVNQQNFLDSFEEKLTQNLMRPIGALKKIIDSKIQSLISCQILHGSQ